MKKLVESFSIIGASDNHILKTLQELYQHGLINSIDAREIDINSVIVITLTGGYYYNVLIRRSEYLENIMFDTPIFNVEIWEQIYSLNEDIKHENNILSRVRKRRDRMMSFLDYIENVEKEFIKKSAMANYSFFEEIEQPIRTQFQDIVNSAKIYYPDRSVPTGS